MASRRLVFHSECICCFIDRLPTRECRSKRGFTVGETEHSLEKLRCCRALTLGVENQQHGFWLSHARKQRKPLSERTDQESIRGLSDGRSMVTIPGDSMACLTQVAARSASRSCASIRGSIAWSLPLDTDRPSPLAMIV